MKKTIVIAAALATLTTTALADDLALGCFIRAYDKAHLARHPDQLVTAVKLRIKRPPPDTGAQYWFDFEARVRGRNDSLHTSGICNEKAAGLHCFVECDGGGVDVVNRGDHVMMYLERIRVAACGEELKDDGGGEELRRGKDDRVFRLDRVNARACAGMKP